MGEAPAEPPPLAGEREKGGRLGLHFDMQDHNVRWPDVCRFLSLLLSRLRRPLTVVLARLSAHRGAASRLKARFGDRIEFEWLPACAPELNPVEHVWGHPKYGDLANYVPEDIDALRNELTASLDTRQRAVHGVSNGSERGRASGTATG